MLALEAQTEKMEKVIDELRQEIKQRDEEKKDLEETIKVQE